jgi:hypothetical protein
VNVIGALVVGIGLGGGVGLIVGARARAAKARPVFAPAAVEWVCRECGQTTPAQRGDRQQLKLEVWDTYGHMIAEWPVGEGEDLASRPAGEWIVGAVRGVVEHHNAQSRALRLKVVK